MCMGLGVYGCVCAFVGVGVYGCVCVCVCGCWRVWVWVCMGVGVRGGGLEEYIFCCDNLYCGFSFSFL